MTDDFPTADELRRLRPVRPQPAQPPAPPKESRAARRARRAQIASDFSAMAEEQVEQAAEALREAASRGREFHYYTGFDPRAVTTPKGAVPTSYIIAAFRAKGLSAEQCRVDHQARDTNNTDDSGFVLGPTCDCVLVRW